jgi:hypothetical protein
VRLWVQSLALPKKKSILAFANTVGPLYSWVPYPQIQNIWKKISVENVDFFLVIILYAMEYDPYLCRNYIVLGIKSNLEMI